MPASRCGVIWRRPGWRGSDSVRSSASTAGRPSISRIRFPSAAVIVSGSPSAWQPCVIPRLGCSSFGQHQRDRRIGVRRFFPEHAAARLAARRARAGDQQPGRGVGDAGDEVGGVELRRIDQHGHRRAVDVAAQRLAHALPELRARDARVRRARPGRNSGVGSGGSPPSDLHRDRVRVLDLFGAGQHARRRAADHRGARQRPAHGRQHARVFVVVVLDAGEDDRDVGRARCRQRPARDARPSLRR